MSSSEQPTATCNSSVLITRRTWDWYFIPFVLVLAITCTVTWWSNGDLRLLGMPIPFIMLWGSLRLKTPKEGLQTTTLKGTPGAIPLLIWILVTLIATVVMCWVDKAVFGHGFREPPQLYQLPFVIGLFSIFSIGVFVIEQRYKRKRVIHPTDNSEQDRTTTVTEDPSP